MSGRRRSLSFRCAEDECREAALYEYRTNADYARLHREQRERPWRCVRHSRPDEVLTPANLARSLVLTAEKSKRFPELAKLFWRHGDAADVSSGFVFGPGFKAFADDFPEGTRLIITAIAEVTA